MCMREVFHSFYTTVYEMCKTIYYYTFAMLVEQYDTKTNPRQTENIVE